MLDVLVTAALSITARSADGSVAAAVAATAAGGVLDAVGLLVSARPTGAEQPSAGAALSAQAVSQVLETLDLCVSVIISADDPTLLTADALTSVASSTAALLSASSASMSAAGSSAALSLLAVVAASPASTVGVASAVAAGLASALTYSAAVNDTALQLRGMSVIGSLATVLNAAPSDAAGAAAASDVRDSLLNTVAASAEQSTVDTVTADALIDATALLLNASSSGDTRSMSSAASAAAVSLTASTAARMLDALGSIVASQPSTLSPSGAANVAGSTAALVADPTSLTAQGGSTALTLFMAVATAPDAPMTLTVADAVAFGLSAVLDAPSVNTQLSVTQSMQAHAGELVDALSASLLPLVVAAPLPQPPPAPWSLSELPPAPSADAVRYAVPTAYFAVTVYANDLAAFLTDAGAQAVVDAMATATGSTSSRVSVLSGEFTLSVELALAGVNASATSAASLRPALLVALLPPPLSSSSLAMSLLGLAPADALQPSAGVNASLLVATTDLADLQQFNATLAAALRDGSATTALQAAGVSASGAQLTGATQAGVQLHFALGCPADACNMSHVLEAVSPAALSAPSSAFLADLSTAGLGAISSLAVTLAALVVMPSPPPPPPAPPPAPPPPPLATTVSVAATLSVAASDFTADTLSAVASAAQQAVASAGSQSGTLPPTAVVTSLASSVDVTLMGRDAGAELSYAQAVRLSAAIAGALSAATQLPIDGADVQLSQAPSSGNVLTIAVRYAVSEGAAAVLAVCGALEQAAQAPWAAAALPAGVSIAAVDAATVSLVLTVTQGVLAAPPASVASASSIAAGLQNALTGAPLRAALSAAGIVTTAAPSIVAVSGLPPPAWEGLTITSAAVNISVGVCNTALLSQQPLQLPGGVVSASLPVEALAGAGASVSSIFYALSFDPHASTPNSTGVVRLEFQSGGAPVAVANLSRLITFELPHTPSAPGASAQASFWDAAAQRYSTDGVVAIPNPVPDGITLEWDAAFDASASQELNRAWHMSGPALRSCREVLLNCSDPVQRLTQRVSLDPHESIGDPAVGCANRTAGIMRVLIGHTCALWRVNTSGCYWCAR
jgi:hypothetical protein